VVVLLKTRGEIMEQQNLKWLGFICGIILVLTILYSSTKGDMSGIQYKEIIFIISLIIIPAVLASIFSLFEKFNWLYVFGTIYFILGILLLSDSIISQKIGILFVILPSLTLFFIPVINKAIYKK